MSLDLPFVIDNGCQYRIENRTNGYWLSPTQEDLFVEWILPQMR
jgi:hypothetical protein